MIMLLKASRIKDHGKSTYNISDCQVETLTFLKSDFSIKAKGVETTANARLITPDELKQTTILATTTDYQTATFYQVLATVSNMLGLYEYALQEVL